MAGDPMRITFAGGAGWHTKTPTLDQLFPEPDYPITRGSTISPGGRRIETPCVWKSSHDPTNYDLKAARNFKWEVRGNAGVERIRIVGNYFRENMTRVPHLDRRTHPDLPRIRHRTAQGYGVHRTAAARMASLQGQNGIPDRRRQDQRKPHIQAGHQFSLSTRRIRALATKLIVSGAYFKNPL